MTCEMDSPEDGRFDDIDDESEQRPCKAPFQSKITFDAADD